MIRLDSTFFKDTAAALMAHDASLSEAEALAMAVEIGDTPEISGGMVRVHRGGKLYEIPVQVVFAEGAEA